MIGKVALVTGGGSGIGRATAIKFASEGASVVIGNRNEKAGQETVDLIQEAGGKASFCRTDVTKLEHLQNLVKYTVDTYGGLHAAFNNAGVHDPQAMTTEQSEETFELLMDVNVRGAWYSMKCEIEHMLENGGGAIVNNSSAAGVIGFPGHAHYVASKHAVLGLTKTAAVEYAKQGIRVNAVCPGGVETRMADTFARGDSATREYIKSLHPIGRLAQPEEIANAVVWLCSDEASFVLGQGINIDGGLTAI